MGGNYTIQGAPSQGGPRKSEFPLRHRSAKFQFRLNANTSILIEQRLYSLNLSTSFPVNGFLKDTFLHSTESSMTQYLGGGAFFTDVNQTTLYSMAGNPNNATDGINSLNAYDVQHDSWSPVSPSGNAALNKLDRGAGMFATTESTGLGLGFLAGGIDWVPGMTIFDASDTSNVSWTNATGGIPFFWGPATEYVRFGTKGVLVVVGGYASTEKKEQRDMSAIQIYDIDSQQWFQVSATGDIPVQRSDFCSSLGSAADDSSFQMTIYGGANDQGIGVLDDVYVLTMPAFRWIQITSQRLPGVNITRSRRHLCSTYHDRQMLALGGDSVDAQQNPVGGCQSQYPPLKLLDTSTYTWQTTFPIANSTYEVPSQVYNIIGGDGSGSSSMHAPGSGFNATIGGTAASAIFSKRIAKYRTLLEANPSQTSTTPSPTPSPSGGVSTGAIVGAVLGSLVFIAGLILLLILLQRRKKAQRIVQLENPPKWQETELHDWSSSSGLVTRKSRAFQTHEVSADNTEALKPKELPAEPSDYVGVDPKGLPTKHPGYEDVMHAELDAAHEPPQLMAAEMS